ncbi:energy-coupling factor transporter transmembrane component T, partial [Bordetella pertussis]|uniref:energy-coupling factor transporter transmembrane component T n=1 Tax=Bordetella pertussis TaxID=520 RepID=UPI000AC9935B
AGAALLVWRSGVGAAAWWRQTRGLALIVRALRPAERLGLLNAAQVALALALALALRFIPEIWRNYQEIREAQAARGLGAHPLALLVPLVVRTLKRAEEVAQAIDARG